jgi:DNA-binding response OmpR family regulator
MGFGHPESIQLLEGLRRHAPQHNFNTPNGDNLEDASSFDLVLVWCPRSTDDAGTLIADSIATTLPVVALVNGTDLPRVDFNSGHLEMAFSPVSTAETLARMELAIARAHGLTENNLITHGDLVIDQDRYEVRLAGSKVDLTYKEYELLKYIAARPGRVFSREALLRAVWDYDYFGGTRTVDVHVRRLRSKINDVRYQFIETVWNVGYRFRPTYDHDSDAIEANRASLVQ